MQVEKTKANSDYTLEEGIGVTQSAKGLRFMDINKKAADDKVVPPNPEVDGVIKHTDEQTGAVLYLETNPPQEPPKTNNTPVAGELPLLK